MATGTTNDFNYSRDQIINEALRKLGVLALEDNADAATFSKGYAPSTASFAPSTCATTISGSSRLIRTWWHWRRTCGSTPLAEI